MLCPKLTYQYIIAARDPFRTTEGWKLKRATDTPFLNLSSRTYLSLGAISKLITDNGPEVKGAQKNFYDVMEFTDPHFTLQFSSNGVVEQGTLRIQEG